MYVSSRRLGNSVKVSLHEPGPARFALTREFVRSAPWRAPSGRDARLAVEWEPPRPVPPRQIARPLAMVVPWDEVIERDFEETGDVVWTPAPSEGECVHFDLVYTPAGVAVSGHPGARSMGTGLVARVELENGERVWITSRVEEMSDEMRAEVDRLRSVPIFDLTGEVVTKTGMLAFGTEPNPDADDGTFVGVLIDVTRPDET